MRIIELVVLLLMCVHLISCTSNEQAPGAASGINAQGISNKDITIKILPETPTVLTDLQTILTGLDNYTYQWEKNGEIIKGENTERLSKDKFAKDDKITVKAIAGAKTISASVVIANSRPIVTAVSLSPQYVVHGTDITATPTGFDADGDFVRFNYRWLVNGQEVSRDATLKGNKFKRGDVVELEVVAYDNDGEGEVFRGIPLTIPNAPPKFISVSLTTSSENTYTYSVRAEDADGDKLTYSITDPPKGMVIDAATGQITWQIAAREDAGKHDVEIVVQDEKGLKTSQKYTMEVTIPEEGQK